MRPSALAAALPGRDYNAVKSKYTESARQSGLLPGRPGGNGSVSGLCHAGCLCSCGEMWSAPLKIHKLTSSPKGVTKSVTYYRSCTVGRAGAVGEARLCLNYTGGLREMTSQSSATGQVS